MAFNQFKSQSASFGCLWARFWNSSETFAAIKVQELNGIPFVAPNADKIVFNMLSNTINLREKESDVIKKYQMQKKKCFEIEYQSNESKT